jgi:hypothetical protein
MNRIRLTYSATRSRSTPYFSTRHEFVNEPAQSSTFTLSKFWEGPILCFVHTVVSPQSKEISVIHQVSNRLLSSCDIHYFQRLGRATTFRPLSSMNTSLWNLTATKITSPHQHCCCGFRQVRNLRVPDAHPEASPMNFKIFPRRLESWSMYSWEPPDAEPGIFPFAT